LDNSSKIRAGIYEWITLTITPISVFVRITLYYVMFVIGEKVITELISWSLGSGIENIPFIRDVPHWYLRSFRCRDTDKLCRASFFLIYLQFVHLNHVMREANSEKQIPEPPESIARLGLVD